MITSNGTSKIGIWFLRPNTTYEPNDLVLGETTYNASGDKTMVFAPVIKRFTTSTSVSIDDYESYLNSYNPGNSYLTKSQVVQIINSYFRYFTALGNSQVITGDITRLTTPGIYVGTTTTYGLPINYGTGTDKITFVPDNCLIRISSSIPTNSIFWELIDFKNNYYFVRRASSDGSNVVDWVELTGESISDCNVLLTTATTKIRTLQERTNALLDDYSKRLQYIKVLEASAQGNILSGLFDSDEIKGYLINLTVTETVNGYVTKQFSRKYSIRVESEDAYGSEGFIYDEFGTQRTDKNVITLGTGVYITSIYQII